MTANCTADWFSVSQLADTSETAKTLFVMSCDDCSALLTYIMRSLWINAWRGVLRKKGGAAEHKVFYQPGATKRGLKPL